MMEAKSGLAIEVGRRVYDSGVYGMEYGTIYAVYGEPGRIKVERLLGGAMVMGGSCDVDIVMDNGRLVSRLPEAILLSPPWKLIDAVVDAEKIAEGLAAAACKAAERKAKEDEKRAAFAKAQEAAKAEGIKLGLIPEADFRAAGKRGSAAAYNLRLELKAKGIKARVRQDGYSSIDIYVADEKDLPEAKAIGCKYEAGRFDGMTDCYDYDPSAWGSVFGDVRYVFERVEGK